MIEHEAISLLDIVDSLEHQLSVRPDCCGCGRGDPEDDIEKLRELIEIYRDGPKRPGY